MTEIPGSGTVSTKLQRIAKLAREAPGMAFTGLSHHIDFEFLLEAYRRTRKDGAPGVDGQTAEDYEKDLEGNLRSLLDRFKSGAYRAPPVRRVHIPKGDGKKTRPIGIPGLEDKALQRAVTMVLTEVYEQDFRDSSYGFRPRRSAHQALERLWRGLMEMQGGWVLELDIQSFFDELDHGWLRTFLDQRVRDGVIRRTIDKWLKAGVMEEGELSFPDSGSPQGGVISPILANVYLHEVLDTWFEDVVIPRLQGRAFIVRYADDAVLVFELERDARKVMDVLPKRFEKHGLRLHPEKTRRVDFRRPPPPRDESRGGRGGRPETSDLLGFTHHWGTSRQGHPVVQRKTSRSRLNRAIKTIAHWCRRFRHLPLWLQHQTLVRKMRGHYAYYGITGNGPALTGFNRAVFYAWKKWLSRRSQRRMTWEIYLRFLRKYPLPVPRIVHSIYKCRAANP